MSLETAFALDLPKFMMREPPPFICDMKKNSRPPMSSTGNKMPKSVNSGLSLGTSTL